MKVLVFGGTGFIGRHLVEQCRAAGDDVTLVNRGLSDRAVFADLEQIIADRDGDLSALAGRRWDRVYDTCGYLPSSVRAAMRVAGDAPYVFVSSISVYAGFADRTEDGPLHPPWEDGPVSLQHYGGQKVACERALPSNASIVRAGLVLGPHDYDRRFRWLTTRIARGGDVIAPGNPEAHAQFVDVRDLASFLRVAPPGAFNTVCPPVSMRELFEMLRTVTGSEARFRWAPDEVLEKHGVRPYSEMPFWLPAKLGASPVPIARAVAAGLACRAPIETLRDAWDWTTSGWESAASVREHRELRVPAGIDADRERAILADLVDVSA